MMESTFERMLELRGDMDAIKAFAIVPELEKGELNPDGIKRELELLFKNPQARSSALKARLAQFDRDTLAGLRDF